MCICVGVLCISPNYSFSILVCLPAGTPNAALPSSPSPAEEKKLGAMSHAGEHIWDLDVPAQGGCTYPLGLY
jgi:hypothetical protein